LFFVQVAEAEGVKQSHLLHRTATSKTAVSTNRTTNSSKAVVISSKSKVPNQKSNLHQVEPSQGFFEEDEDEERQAALSSPIKGGKRLSNAVKYTHVNFEHFLTDFMPGYCQT
jgi:hypothetical protein